MPDREERHLLSEDLGSGEPNPGLRPRKRSPISSQVEEVDFPSAMHMNAVEALYCLVGQISSLMVAMEALSNNITTSIMKKNEPLGGDFCRSVMVSSSLSKGWILNYTCNLW